jgi:AcrR family transcriptional regulator
MTVLSLWREFRYDGAMETAPVEQDALHGVSMGRRERKKLETRIALHRAALDLFAKKGFRNTRISEIVDAVDVSESTFFRYFDSKEGVALEGIRQRAAAIMAAVRARPASESPIEACLAANRGDEMPRHRLKEADLPGLELMSKTPELASKARHMLDQIVFELAENFARRLDQNSSSLEVRLQAHAVLAASTAALEVWIEDPVGSDLQKLSEQALMRLQRGLQPETR